MDYTEFCNKIFTAVKDYMGDDVQVSLDRIVKNNGTVLYGLIIRTKQARISPTLYLEKFYEKYEDGGNFGEIFKDVINFYESNSTCQVDMGYFTDYDSVKDRIIYKLINYEMNRDMLNDVPHVRWNDLAIVFCHVVDSPELGFATILIKNEHLALWNVTSETVYEAACRNTPEMMGDEFETMENVLLEMMSKCADEEQREDILGEIRMQEASDIFVLSNRYRIFGAAGILYSDYIKKLAQMYGSGVYIIPCSIHEVICIPEKNCMDAMYMRQMIKDVNDNEVAVEERLSDSLYFYDPDKNEIRIAV